VLSAEDGQKSKRKKKEKLPTKRDLDILWSKLVRARDKVCQFNGCNNPRIFSHHIFSRRFTSTRFDINNGISLCYVHHIHFAHVDYEGFRKVIISKIGEELFNELFDKSRIILKPTKDFIVETYKKLMEKLNEFT
jgi:hypothetical protein